MNVKVEHDFMKRIFVIVLSLILISTTFLTSFAESSSVYDESQDDDKNTKYIFSYIGYFGILGVDPPTRRDASMARRLLRYSANLEDPTEDAVLLGDVNFDGKVDASDARTLLRYTANLSNFSITVRVGEKVYIAPLFDKEVKTPTKYKDLDIDIYFPPQNVEAIEEFNALTATPKAPGKYTLEIVYPALNMETYDSLRLDIICVE